MTKILLSTLKLETTLYMCTFVQWYEF